MSDITPQRLEELLAGDPPRSDAERDVLHMAAALRGAAPDAPDRLRERVMDASRREPVGSRRFRLPAMPVWSGPAVAGLAAVVIGAAVILPGVGGDGGPVPVLTAGGGAKEGARAADDGATPAAPEATMAPAPVGPAGAGPDAAPAPPPEAMTVAASAVVVGPSAGWPDGALDAVAAPLEAAGGVVTSASTGTSLDGRDDLRVEALVPAANEADAIAAVTASLRADTAWQPSDGPRIDVGDDDARTGTAPEALAAGGAVAVTVVVVRDGTP